MSAKSRANSSFVSPIDYEVALYLHWHKDQISKEHHEFIDRMADRLAPIEATPKQRVYLQNLLIKLAARIG
jgi:hypothetical protein